ncbi:HAD family hydrolase [Bacillus tianshenii]|nr:HAD family hydrolase [Bacillus tianshenii]
MDAFASDLDRTLIYSYRFLNEEIAAVPIERFEGRVISYITESALNMLTMLSEQMHVIPVTTRTEAQFRRIAIFQEHIKPQYAVTSNGGKILVNGKLDESWEKQIALEMDRLTLSVSEAFAHLQQYNNEKWLKTLKIADELFIYCVLHEDYFPAEQLEVFVNDFESSGWVVNQQGRKVYFLPKCIGKEKALRYINEQYGIRTKYAAGDAMLDRNMLHEAEYGFCPLHGEIAARAEQLYEVTAREGMHAAEDIIESIAKHAGTSPKQKPKLSAHS